MLEKTLLNSSRHLISCFTTSLQFTKSLLESSKSSQVRRSLSWSQPLKISPSAKVILFAMTFQQSRECFFSRGYFVINQALIRTAFVCSSLSFWFSVKCNKAQRSRHSAHSANPQVFWFLKKLYITQFYEGFLEKVHSINAIIWLLHQQPTISISDKIYYQSINLSVSAIYAIWIWPSRLTKKLPRRQIQNPHCLLCLVFLIVQDFRMTWY